MLISTLAKHVRESDCDHVPEHISSALKQALAFASNPKADLRLQDAQDLAARTLGGGRDSHFKSSFADMSGSGAPSGRQNRQRKDKKQAWRDKKDKKDKKSKDPKGSK